jgi:hypothetical protein
MGFLKCLLELFIAAVKFGRFPTDFSANCSTQPDQLSCKFLTILTCFFGSTALRRWLSMQVLAWVKRLLKQIMLTFALVKYKSSKINSVGFDRMCKLINKNYLSPFLVINCSTRFDQFSCKFQKCF